MGIKGNKETDRLADKGTNIVQFYNYIHDKPMINKIRSIARSLKYKTVIISRRPGASIYQNNTTNRDLSIR
jgi:hypothetical protein